jgi:gamma-glutamyl:cysteine ligase YbdK (ATP-grasp superfamily)
VTGAPAPLPLFSACGIELEYMIVDRDRLDVLPVCDELLHAVAGEPVSELEDGPIAWSNELVLHVVELKTNGPVPALLELPAQFLEGIRRANALLEPLNGRLLPGAMHPWMDPQQETRLWPHGGNEIYAAFNSIFDCRGHGWANLQSMHVNLPFAGDAEFGALHGAVRVLLPVLPALAASSPIADGRSTGFMDTRLEVYRRNAECIPSITGLVVPEAVSSRGEYEQHILAPMYAEISASDPDGVLQHEWLNARGAIARFERNAIEIRVLDMQESPAQDLAIAGAVTDVLKTLTRSFQEGPAPETIETPALAHILLDTVRDAELAVIERRDYLRLLGFPDRRCEARELWQFLLESQPVDAEWQAAIRNILAHGCLARRLERAVGRDCRPARLHEAWRVLGDCLESGSRFEGID